MQDFEATKSVPNTGTGSRREGAHFEHLVADMWEVFAAVASSYGAKSSEACGTGKRRYTRLAFDKRVLFVPTAPGNAATTPDYRWLEVSFLVEELIAAFPSKATAIAEYSPSTGPYQGDSYPEQYSGLSTRFDDTLVLEDSGVLKEKILLEYKTAKSSTGRQIDGNAHERLSFQVMQYLEIATRYAKCSMTVIANGAFAHYRNKYHVNFHVQANRLRNFSWFSMEHACTAPEYTAFLSGLLAWLIKGTPRVRNN